MTSLHVPGRVLNAKELVDEILRAELAMDWDRWRELFAEDVIIDHPRLGPQVGIEANLEVVRRFRETVVDYRRDVFDVVADESSAAYRFSITGYYDGTGLGRSFGGPRPVQVNGAAFQSAWQGQVVRIVELIGPDSFGAP